MIEKNIWKCFWILQNQFYLYLDLRRSSRVGEMKYANNVKEILNQQKQSYEGTNEFIPQKKIKLSIIFLKK
jgi:hypothetical protein